MSENGPSVDAGDENLDSLGRRRRDRVFEQRVTVRFSDEEVETIQQVQAELQAQAPPGKTVSASAAVRWIISHQKDSE